VPALRQFSFEFTAGEQLLARRGDLVADPTELAAQLGSAGLCSVIVLADGGPVLSFMV
jgi:hypothetical protein